MTLEQHSAHTRIPLELIGKFQQALPGVRQWVDDTLYAHREQTSPANPRDYLRLLQVFPHELLSRSRCVVVAGNPPFPPLSRMGLPELGAFEAMPISGVTYRDTFFVREGQQSESLYFHEIVHVIQWDRLGVDRFLMAYGVGLMQSGYRNSPLEEMAYRLQADFDRSRIPGDLVGLIQEGTDRIWEDVATLIGNP
jgi:hypothetical protein